MTATTAEADVRAVLDRLTRAWNDADAAAYGRLFTEDADYVTLFGLTSPAALRSRVRTAPCSKGRRRARS